MTSTDLINRIKKRHVHLRKWAKRDDVTCFRIYERDLPDYPLIVDWYDGDVVAWMYTRKRDDTDAQKVQFRQGCIVAICDGLGVSEHAVYLKYRGRQKGLDTQYEKLGRVQNCKVVEEGGLKLEVNLSDYLDTGLFLDHRNTRKMVRDMAKGKRVLNLFAYTGSFTCYAIDGGAISTTTVDLNPNYSKWTERNLALNGVDGQEPHCVITDNCLAFVKNDAAHHRYDLIICDPPTFSNSKRMKTTFSVDDDYVDLIKSCIKLLAPSGTLIFSTNSRSFKLDPNLLPSSIVLSDISAKTVPEDFRNKKIHRCWQIKKGG